MQIAEKVDYLLDETRAVVAREISEVRSFALSEKPNLLKFPPSLHPSVLKYCVEGLPGLIQSEGLAFALRRMVCRLYGHQPHGVVWYNPGGFEPDMSCRNCGEDLG